MDLNDLIESEDIGNTYQITLDGDPNFLRKPGTRHPLALTMDLATSIFEDIFKLNQAVFNRWSIDVDQNFSSHKRLYIVFPSPRVC